MCKSRIYEYIGAILIIDVKRRCYLTLGYLKKFRGPLGEESLKRKFTISKQTTNKYCGPETGLFSPSPSRYEKRYCTPQNGRLPIFRYHWSRPGFIFLSPPADLSDLRPCNLHA
jgi:hypothetical protein